jgi:hypothetical protein
MASVYPGAVDAFSDPLSNSPLSSPSHSQLHSDVNDALEKIETYVPRRNLVYNGAMQIHQRGTSTTGITTSGYYTADRWQHGIDTLGTWTSTVENDAPTGSGFRKSLKLLCTTADASPVTTDNVGFQHQLEGQDLQLLRKGTSSAEQVTVSFWVKSNVTGTYICELYDFDNTRQVSKSYTVSASGVWEQKTITFPADTSGVLDNDNNGSLMLRFWLAAGPSFTSGTLNSSAWAANNNANRAVGQVNLGAATNNYWQVTGVQMNVGAVAAPFQFKSYEQDLAECQRYYFRLNQSASSTATFGQGLIISTSTGDINIIAPVTMRTKPNAIDSAGSLQLSDGYAFGATVTGISLRSNSCTEHTVAVQATTGSTGFTTGRQAFLIANTDTTARFGASAEL